MDIPKTGKVVLNATQPNTAPNSSKSAPTIADIIKKNITKEHIEYKKMAEKKKEKTAAELQEAQSLSYMKRCAVSFSPNRTKNKKYSNNMLNNTKSEVCFDYDNDHWESDLEDEYSSFAVCDCYQGCSSCMDDDMFELDDDFENMNL
jgi:hypothetical protein